MLTYLLAAIAVRLHEIAANRDRGDNPVPTAIIIGGLATLAAVVVAWATARATSFMNATPGGPAS